MIELKLIQDNGIKAQLLEKWGYRHRMPSATVPPIKRRFWEAQLCHPRWTSCYVGPFTEPGLGAMLGDGLIRAAWNHCSSHGIKTARFSDEFPMESLQPLEFFRDFSHEDIDIEKFFSEGKNVDKPDRNPCYLSNKSI